jgi:hypothetical protein
MSKTWVKTDKEWISSKDVEIIDCEEGLWGDEVTFIYEGVEYKSRVVIGSKPG